MNTYFIFFINFLPLLSTLEAFSNDGNNTIAAFCLDITDEDFQQYIPHPYNCTLYFECPEELLKSCKDGLVFNPTSGLCDWPRNVDCTDKPNPNPGDCCKTGEEVRYYLKSI